MYCTISNSLKRRRMAFVEVLLFCASFIFAIESAHSYSGKFDQLPSVRVTENINNDLQNEQSNKGLINNSIIDSVNSQQDRACKLNVSLRSAEEFSYESISTILFILI